MEDDTLPGVELGTPVGQQEPALVKRQVFGAGLPTQKSRASGGAKPSSERCEKSADPLPKKPSSDEIPTEATQVDDIPSEQQDAKPSSEPGEKSADPLLKKSPVTVATDSNPDGCKPHDSKPPAGDDSNPDGCKPHDSKPPAGDSNRSCVLDATTGGREGGLL